MFSKKLKRHLRGHTSTESCFFGGRACFFCPPGNNNNCRNRHRPDHFERGWGSTSRQRRDWCALRDRSRPKQHLARVCVGVSPKKIVAVGWVGVLLFAVAPFSR
jgi:hypothetical protein